MTPGGARSGVSIRPQIRCQPTLGALFGRAEFERKDRFGAARGLPLSVRSESIEGAEANLDMAKNQDP